MAVVFYIQVLIMIPLTVIIGIASASIGFSSWLLVLPLLFVGFDYDLFDAIFTSVCIDLLNGIALTVLYARIKKVDWIYGVAFGILGTGGAIGGVFFAKTILSRFSQIVKGSIPYAVFVIGIGFLIRGIVFWRRHRKEKQNVVPDLQSEVVPIVTQINNDKETITLLPQTRWKPDSRVVWIVLHLVFAVIAVICGAFSGILGFGSGMNFVVLFMIIFRLELPLATGTGCFIVAQLMLAVGIGYVAGLVPLSLGSIWHITLISMGGSLVGVLLGMLFQAKISQVMVNFFIAGILVILGIIGTIQKFVLTH